jgi:hypothetical protein
VASYNKLRQRVAIAVVAGLGLSGCGENECCDPFSPAYYAVAYGLVTQNGVGVTDIEVAAQVFLASCSLPGIPAGHSQTRSGGGGAYRLLLSSSSQAEGQCLSLTVAGVSEPVLRTLTGMPFSAEASTQVRDSIEINVEIP